MTKRVLLLILVFALLVLSACGGKTPEATQAPAPTLRPTFTPTVAVAAPAQPGTPATAAPAQPEQPPAVTPEAEAPTATPEQPPTPTPEPAPTDTPAPAQVQVTANVVNLRSGPGTSYPRVTQAKQGQTFEILAKNADGSWFQVSANGKTAWVINDARWTSTVGNTATVTVAENIPAPPPTPKPRPTATPAPTNTPAPTLLFKRFSMEPRPSNNPIVTIFAGLWNSSLDPDHPISGYNMTVVLPNGQHQEFPFGNVALKGDPGPAGTFVYTIKAEFPLVPGVYKLYVSDGSGQQVSEIWEANVAGNTRTFIPYWQQK